MDVHHSLTSVTHMQRPWGSAFPHILGSALSAFLTHFAAVVSTEAWQYRPHRLITFRLDVLLGGAGAALRHLDNILEFDVGFILYEQVHCFTACELHAPCRFVAKEVRSLFCINDLGA